MSTINDTDLLLVNRRGVDYKTTALELKEQLAGMSETDLLLINRSGRDYALPATEIEALTDDADLLVINREGADYKVSGKDLKDYLIEGGLPWDEEIGIYHVLLNDKDDLSGSLGNYANIYNVANQQKVSKITSAGEWILAGPETRFHYSEGNWTFGPLTDTSKTTSMVNMFMNAKNFNSDLSRFDTSNVAVMAGMFREAQKFNQNLDYFDTSNVTNMSRMFSHAYIFNADVTTWDTSRVTTFFSMFSGCEEFNQDIGGWDTSSAVQMYGMFLSAEKFNQDIGGWDTYSIPWDGMDSIFAYASVFNQDLSGWCVKKIKNKPASFTYGSSMNNHTPYQPIWGSCPGPDPVIEIVDKTKVISTDFSVGATLIATTAKFEVVTEGRPIRYRHRWHKIEPDGTKVFTDWVSYTRANEIEEVSIVIEAGYVQYKPHSQAMWDGGNKSSVGSPVNIV